MLWCPDFPVRLLPSSSSTILHILISSLHPVHRFGIFGLHGIRWALTNPHLSLHIPEDSRVTISTQTKKNGMPRRPSHSLRSIMSNIHLLTDVPSFARWPLNVHFLDKDAFRAWENRIKAMQKPSRDGLRILTNFNEQRDDHTNSVTSTSGGIHSIPLDYAPIAAYVAKAHDVVNFEQEGNCVHCGHGLASGKELHAMCPNASCTAMGHLDCWSRHALSDDVAGHIIPENCVCPSCRGDVRWGDMMKELTLRMRGGGEVKKLLRGIEKAKSNS